MKMTKKEEKMSVWEEIWESEEYTAEIYEGCTTRVYKHKEKNKLKVEVDGTKWTGNSGVLHTYKYFIDDRDDIKAISRGIQDFDDDECTDEDISNLIEMYTHEFDRRT